MKRFGWLVVLVLVLEACMAGKAQNNDFVADAVDFNSSGWVEESEENTWTYSSADSPSFVASVNADMTAVLSVGMRVRLTQTTVKYFIVTKVGAYSAGATLITLYGGTDYTLADATISDVGWSSQKAPFGFPLDPDKWTVTTTYSSTTSQASPASTTYYNIGSVSVSIPIGVWYVRYRVYIQNLFTGTAKADIFVTLSTANNSESDVNNTLAIIGYGDGQIDLLFEKSVPIVLALTSKTTYYLNESTINASNELKIFGGTLPVLIKAVCAYL